MRWTAARPARCRTRQRLLRRSARPGAVVDWRLWTGAVLAVLAAVLLAGGDGGVVPGALAGAGGGALVHGRYRRSAVEVELGRQIARERRCARELAALRGAGWTVLPDRVLPETEHRLAHVLAGPAGRWTRPSCRPAGWCGSATAGCGPGTPRWPTGSPSGGGR